VEEDGAVVGVDVRVYGGNTIIEEVRLYDYMETSKRWSL